MEVMQLQELANHLIYKHKLKGLEELKEWVNEQDLSKNPEDEEQRKLLNELIILKDFIVGRYLKNKTLDKEDIKRDSRRAYDLIVEILDEYMDIDVKFHPLIASWIIGTYFHNEFPSYPYLFLNAMKGSGKTRLMAIIKELSFKGDMLNSLTEAVLFRTEGTLCIDEFEGVTRKGNESLRELLNSAYKRGTKVKRMRKKKSMDGEEQVVEEFNMYRPIVMANINGMENVTGDRCLTITLEKSNNQVVTRLMELFEYDERFVEVKELLNKFGVVSVVQLWFLNVYKGWNKYLSTTTQTTHTIQTNNNTNNIEKEQISEYLPFYALIRQININGRHLELSFPIFLLSHLFLGDDVFKKITTLMTEIVFEKKEQDFMENKDILVYDFVSQYHDRDFISVAKLSNQFREFIDAREDDKWCNSRWFGRSLKRLNLVLDKRRVGRAGVQVQLDIARASEKIKVFKEDDSNGT
tara:strand:+ start:2966 stop:4363 length:1398 start_codon:yes stop_codon:yes gene_type:complete